MPVQHANPQEVFAVIVDAASQDPAKVKASSDRLKQLLEMAGTSDALSEIAAQKDVDVQVRQQSIIQLKNSALSHWRSRRLIPDQDRAKIRARCLMFLNEPDDLIAECNELITSKIARYDYPLQWHLRPNLINDLLAVIQTNIAARSSGAPYDFLALRRSLELLNAVIKEMGSAKLMAGVKSTMTVIEQTHAVMQNHYSTVAPALTSLNPSSISTPRAAEDILLAHLVYKCLVKSAVYLWQRLKKPEEKATVDPWIHDLFKNSVIQLETLMELRINLVLALRSGQAVSNEISNRAIIDLTRHVTLFGKFFRRLQQLDLPRFVILPNCSALVSYYWSKVTQATSGPSEFIEDSQTAVFPVRLLVQAMVIFKETLAQWGSSRKDGTVTDQFLSQEFVQEAVRLLVTWFIPLNPSDLEEWMADPEEWVNMEEKDNDHWEYALRPCAERVLLTLATHCRNYVEPLLLETWTQVRAQPSTDLPSILQKEALYCALGRCAHRMKNLIPFDEWLATNLTAEARETNPSFPIVKRRIAWLIGKWISSECSSPNNPNMWEILVHLLKDRGQGTDAVVRLTAAVSIRECVDTIDFDVEIFAPYLPVVVSELIRLTAEADTLESKRRISNSLNAVIERAGLKIVPLMGAIAEPLPQLWLAAGEDWLFKASLLETLTKLIASSKQHSVSLSSLVVPLVQDSLTPAAKIQLDEDALMLLQTALRNTTTLEGVNGGPGLFQLFPVIMGYLGENFDLLGKITGIIESYVLLDPARILQTASVDLFQACQKALEHALSVNVKDICTAINWLIQLCPSSLWGEALHTSGLFPYIVKSLLDQKLSTQILLEFIFIMARIALVDKQMFMQLMSAAAPVLNETEAEVYEGVLNQWWSRFDSMYRPHDRKLTAMGIASLVSTGRPDVLDRLSTEICNMWLDVFGEIKEALERAKEEDEALKLYWDVDPETLFDFCEGTPEYDRRKAAFDSDPVRTTQLTAFIATQIQQAEIACGGAAALQANYLSKADPLVLQQLQKELTSS
ncbi:ARM repeat-containing protein [Abortiporus biennis]|nr:ARM repeat-containing protein [Abortiporus biennis]